MKNLPKGISLRKNESYIVTCRINGKRLTKTVPYLKQALTTLNQFNSLKLKVEGKHGR